MSIATRWAADTAERELTITRLFQAPRHLVFDAWTRDDHIARWWGPRDFTVPSCEIDARPGGAYRACLRSPQGTDYRLQGTYREIARPHRLVFTFAWEDERGRPKHETLCTVTFADQGEATLMTFHQALFDSMDDRDSHHGGWSEAIDKLEALLARG